MSQDLFDLLQPVQQPIQDADSLSLAALAQVPTGDDVFASQAEKAALMRQEPYTRKGTMPERLVTRQQFIEDIFARGFTQRTDFRRGMAMVMKLEHPETHQYYVLNRTFERSYADRRYKVLFPEKAASLPGAGASPAPTGQPKPTRGTKSQSSSTPPVGAPALESVPGLAAGLQPAPVEVPVSTPDQAQPEKPRQEVPVIQELKPEERDYAYDATHYDPVSGRAARIAANLAAIQLLHQLEAEDRHATPEEKKVLARYSGWGADKGCFDTVNAKAYEDGVANQNFYAERYGADHRYTVAMQVPEALVRWKKEYGQAYETLKATLTEQEWSLAAQSVLNAHYTAEPIAHRLWEIAQRIGFEGGNIAEFGCGTGKVLGAMPPVLREKSTVLGVEKDEITARIATKLFPQSKIEVGALEDITVRPNSIDLIIGNVPFSDTAPSGQRGKVALNLHNYFIARAIDALRPGGLAVVITSASTLQNNPEQRALLADRAEMLGAIRLPNDAFQSNANTEVVADILVLRKPDLDVRVSSQPFRLCLPIQVAEGQEFVIPSQIPGGPDKRLDSVMVNEYFVHHPQMVLGVHSLLGKMYGRGEGQYTVASVPGSAEIGTALDQAIASLPERVPNSSINRRRNPVMEVEESLTETLEASRSDKVGGMVERGGKIYEVSRDRELVAPAWHKADFAMPRGLASVAAADQVVRDWMRVRDCLRLVMTTDLNPMATDADSSAARQALRETYDGFVTRNGRLCEHKPLRALLRYEPEFSTVEALELVREVSDAGNKRQRIVEPAAILTVRTLRPAAAPAKAGSVLDAVMVSLGQSGRIDLDYVCQLVGKDDQPAVARLLAQEGIGYQNPKTGLIEHRDMYLTGNIRIKLLDAEAMAASDPVYALNVEALKSVLPVRVPIDQIRYPIGATWIPTEVVNDFVRDTFKQSYRYQVDFYKRGSLWLVPDLEYNTSLVNWNAASLRSEVRATSILEAVLNQQSMRITYTVRNLDGTSTTFFDEAATVAANERAESMRQAWQNYVKGKPDAQALIEDAYNEHFVGVVHPNPDGRALTFPNLASGPGALVPRDHQRAGIMRVLSEQAGVVHYGVGFGKTLVGIISAYESKRMGLAQKPMILCDNANYAQFVGATIRAYPTARILYSTDDDMQKDNRERWKNRVATGDWDLVLMQRSHFERIPVAWQTEQRWLAQELDEIRAIKEEASAHETNRSNKTRKAFVRRLEKALEKAQARLKDAIAQAQARNDQGLTWEQLGVDLLIVDECHREKKTGFATKFDIKGIDPNASLRGRGLLMKARHIQDQRGGKGVVGMSGTVCTNTMAEYWSALRLFHPQRLADYNVERFDDFKTAFCQTEDALELNEANGRWRIVNRLSKFVNGPAFVGLIRSGMDVKMDSEEVRLNVPKLKGGAIELCSVPLTEPVFEKLDALAGIYKAYEEAPADLRKKLSWVPIMLMQCGMAASIDPRLVDPQAPDCADSLVNKLVANVVTIHAETTPRRSAQCVFLDRYNTMDTSVLQRVGAGGLSGVSIEMDDADALLAGGGGSEEAEDGVVEQQSRDQAPVGGWNMYKEIKAKLVAAGIPSKEIAIIHDCRSADERKELFNRVDAGEVRVLLGSSDKMGIGANFQKKLYAAHHLDPCRNMTPDQMDQRNGRIVRDGNENPEVRVIYYGMEDTVTPAVWGRLQRKAAFIKQGLAAKGVGIEFDDTGEIRLEEMKSALISDKRQLKRAELLAEIKELKIEREVHQNRSKNLRYGLSLLQGQIRMSESDLPKQQARAALYQANVVPPYTRPEKWSCKINLSDTPEARLGDDDKTRKLYEKAADMIQETGAEIGGDSKMVLKQLEKLVDALKATPLGSSSMTRVFGILTVNGLPMCITKEQVKLADMSDSIALVAHVQNVAVGAKGMDPLVKPAKFGSAEALFKLAQVTWENATTLPVSTSQALENMRKDCREMTDTVQGLVAFDDSRIHKLEDRLAVLEKDMREQPFIRRTAKSQQALQAADGVVTAANQHAPPSAKTQTVDAGVDVGDQVAALPEPQPRVERRMARI
jgi:N12 class adenine-specific DNA methylase